MNRLQMTPDMIDAARQLIGRTRPSKQHWSCVTKDNIRAYAMAIGDDNPLWLDERCAAATQWGGITAPPSFIGTAFMTPMLFLSDSQVRSSGGGFPGMQGLYTGSRWVFHRPLRPGDELQGTTTRTGVLDASDATSDPGLLPSDEVEQAIVCANSLYPADGGPLFVQVEDHECSLVTGEPVGTYREFLTRLEPEAVEPSKGRYGSVEERTYTDDEIREIDEQYGREAANRRGSSTRYWDDVAVDDAVSPLVKGPLTILSYTAFFTAFGGWFNLTDRLLYNFTSRFPEAIKRDPDTNIWVTPEEMHWQPHAARLLSMPRGFDVGSQRCTWFAHVATDWMGDDGRLLDMVVWFFRPLFLSETTWLRGQVSGKDVRPDGVATVTLSIEATTQDGELLSTGTATVALPRNPGAPGEPDAV